MSFKIHLYVGFLFVILLFSNCNSHKPVIVSCDCESSKNSSFCSSDSFERFNSVVFSNAEHKSSEKSHSGKFSIKLTKESPYGLTYRIQKAKAKEHFKISVWRLGSKNGGSLAVAAENPNDFFMAQSKSNGKKNEDWCEISYDFIIPTTADGKDIKVFVWNETATQAIYFDDLSIEYIEEEVNSPSVETDIFKDSRDGNNYKIVKIGDNWWMAQNLNYALSTSCLCYDNSKINCDKYGKLYDYETALAACPSGWTLPSDEDWKKLERSIGMQDAEISNYGWRGKDEAQKLKEFGSSGFNALLSGTSNGNFYNLFISSYYWTSTELNDSMAWCREISQRFEIGRFRDLKNMHFSVRCIKKRS